MMIGSLSESTNDLSMIGDISGEVWKSVSPDSMDCTVCAWCNEVKWVGAIGIVEDG